ncbi:hypothetical protein [Flavimarina sp. Hel_I_48]|uniref:hypothetical protein n=1 Tax=Flavimarina sp. Hel_I_48 TaxID=1392488 RepID=UPI0004DEF795|nr:hypothetical protein [Flavimarina sp. Hel_I_48]
MRYKILWIDDEYKKQDDLIGDAEHDGIDITPFESHEEGIEELKVKPNYYHAVILDAKVKERKSDTVTNLNGLRASRDFLIECNNEYYLPHFIFTGQPDYMGNEIFEQSFGEFYIKGQDNERLFKDIIVAQEKRKEIQARKEFPKSFLVFDENILSLSHKYLLLDLIESYQKKDYRKKNLNTQRDLLEAIYIALNTTLPVIPNDPLLIKNDGTPIMDHCTLFFELKPIKHKKIYLNHFIPKYIQAAFRKVKESSSQYSHLSEDEIAKYPFLSNFYLLIEICQWMVEFRDQNFPHLK